MGVLVATLKLLGIFQGFKSEVSSIAGKKSFFSKNEQTNFRLQIQFLNFFTKAIICMNHAFWAAFLSCSSSCCGHERNLEDEREKVKKKPPKRLKLF